MSKRDYQAIARAIHGVRQQHPEITQHFNGKDYSAADTLTSYLAAVLAQDSPRFDRSRFLEACETETTRGMAR